MTALIALTLTGCSTATTPTAADQPAASLPISADEITAGFADAGLAVTEPRFNTDNMCGADLYACVEYLTTEEAGVVTYKTKKEAKAVQAMLVSKDLDAGWVFAGTAALNFGGRDTSPAAQKKYAKVLKKLVAAS